MTSRSLRVAAVLLLAGCTASAPRDATSTPQVRVAAAPRRLGDVVDKVLSFRDGLLSEAVDRRRIDREDRAEAATRRIAELELLLDAVPEPDDVDDAVDRDLARMALDAAVADLALARADEPRLRRLAGGATACAFLADPAPPSAATIDLLAGGADGLVEARVPEIPDGTRIDDLRAAAQRNRQAASLLRARGRQSRILDPVRGAGALAAAEEAAKRTEAFAAALDAAVGAAEKAGDRFAPPAGRATFVAYLSTRHGVDASPEELVAFGADLLARTTHELEELARSEFPGRTWKQALDEIRADHADARSIPDEAFAAALAARDFTIAQGFVTIPQGARLGHVEMVDDEMARSYPYAAYGWRRATSEGESGRFLVAPGATWMSDAEREERLRGNCRAWTRVVAAHETWPGHHLQFWVADQSVSRLRRAMGTPVFIEGWGLYCEGLLARHGFFARKDERLAVLAMRAWRAARVVLDVRLHCELLPPKDAIDFLVDSAGLTREAATAEVRRYMSNPTQPFSYAWGCEEIERLRADEERRLAADFDERAFHDRLLRCGPIPFRFVRRLFGRSN